MVTDRRTLFLDDAGSRDLHEHPHHSVKDVQAGKRMTGEKLVLKTKEGEVTYSSVEPSGRAAEMAELITARRDLG